MTENFYRIDDDPNRGMPLKEIPECNPETHVWSSVADSYRFFVKPKDGEGNGYRAILLSLVRGDIGEDLWNPETVEVEVVFTVVAFFDLARHIDHHPADGGYGNYIPTKILACVFRMLSQFESVLCSDYSEKEYY